MQVVERIGEHYEVWEVEGELGRVYKWRPEMVALQCKCGKRMTFKRWDIINSVLYCECGKDTTANIREELVLQLLDENGYEAGHHPWRYWQPCGETGMPF